MPKATNDERSAVANLLRALAGNGMWDEISDYYDSVGPSRIADLIEPDGEGLETTPNCSELLRITRKYSEPTPKCDTSATHTDASATVSDADASCDREALLALAEEMERRALDWDADCNGVPVVHAGRLLNYADGIRAACGDGAWPESDRKEAVRDRPFRERLTGGSDR